MKKIFDLSEKEIALLDKVKEEKELISQVAALRHILKSYEEKEDKRKLIEEAISVYETEVKGFHDRVKWSTTMAERNTIMILDVLNTMLFHEGIENCILVEDIENPVVARSREIMKKKLAHFKQQKDNRKRKG